MGDVPISPKTTPRLPKASQRRAPLPDLVAFPFCGLLMALVFLARLGRDYAYDADSSPQIPSFLHASSGHGTQASCPAQGEWNTHKYIHEANLSGEIRLKDFLYMPIKRGHE